MVLVANVLTHHRLVSHIFLELFQKSILFQLLHLLEPCMSNHHCELKLAFLIHLQVFLGSCHKTDVLGSYDPCFDIRIPRNLSILSICLQCLEDFNLLAFKDGLQSCSKHEVLQVLLDCLHVRVIVSGLR
jgi:hypothetical protein